MKTKRKSLPMFLVITILTVTFMSSAAFARSDEPFMDPGPASEMSERKARFESNPDRVMLVLENLKSAGYARTAYRSAKLYLDSGVSDFRIRNFLDTQRYETLTDK